MAIKENNLSAIMIVLWQLAR